MSYLPAVLAFAALALAAPASAEVASTSADGFVTKATVTVAAPPRTAWLALIKPGDWWNDEHTWSGDSANMTITPKAGGCFCELIPGEGEIPMDGSVQHAVVVQAIPDKALRLRGGLGPLQAVPATGVLTIMLQPVEGGTSITWEYNVGGSMSFEVAQLSKLVDAVLLQQINGLRDHLGALDPDGTESEETAVGEQIDELAEDK